MIVATSTRGRIEINRIQNPKRSFSHYTDDQTDGIKNDSPDSFSMMILIGGSRREEALYRWLYCEHIADEYVKSVAINNLTD